MDNKTLRALVLNYKTKYKEGFIDDEIEDIKNKVEEIVFNFNTEKFEDAFYGNTCMIKDKQLIRYHIDVLNALKCGIENRYITDYEWD